MWKINTGPASIFAFERNSVNGFAPLLFASVNRLAHLTPALVSGDLLMKRKNRAHGRPISTQHSMHFVLRSTQAKGVWSFKRHERAIRNIIEKFAVKNGVRVKSMANVGNHLHLHLQLTNRHTYRAFIRAVTSAIMMTVTGASRWNNSALAKLREARKKFWNRRPFSRVVVGFNAFLTMRDYVAINQLESGGFNRDRARFFVKWVNSG